MLKIVLKSKLRVIGRTMTHDWPTYFILGPVMMGVAFLLGRRIFKDFASEVGRIQPVSISEETAVRLAFAFLALKVFFNFLPLARRLYPTERALTVDDLLPINYRIRYQVFYLEQLFRDLPFFVVGSMILLFFGQTQMLLWPFTIWLFLPGIEIGFTLTWIHFWSPDRRQLAGVLFVMAFFLSVLPVVQFSWWADFFTLLLMPLGYYRGFKIWRYQDMGRVEQFMVRHQNHKNKTAASDLIHRLCQVVPKSIRPLLRRDLILTARNFVPHVWRNMTLLFLVLLAMTTRGTISPAVYCALGAFIMASTVSPLFSLQRPFRPMDRALPLSAEQVWRAKLYYARLLALPVPFLVFGFEMMLRPLPMNEGAVLCFTLFLVGLAVASLVGGSICEGDQRPVLQYIVSAFMSILATLFIAIFNPVMYLLIFPVLSSLKDSAITRLENEEVL